MTCAEIQLKMVLFMGVRDKELIQPLISLDTGASLHDVVTCCRSFEATRNAASAIHSSPSQLRATSTYKKGRRRDKTPQAASSIPKHHLQVIAGRLNIEQRFLALLTPASLARVDTARSARPALPPGTTAGVKVIGRGLTNVPLKQPNVASSPGLATTTGSAATRLVTMVRVAR
ncbi:hypothetical protein GWK47_049621 [Chionoecetes opilio]|uniref:Uncharacterized protein n=1 Tax=Chionoecetes opilio TaxID=41210 RepID=A0A8J4YAU6_CHIOP|nr:hypothetical protein GWK47_049621 [Chionoecetes opilio]